MSTQPQHQQQSFSEEGSKENTILNRPRNQRERSAQVILQAQQTACYKDQTLQHPCIHHRLEDHHRLPQSTIRTKITRIHQNAMEPPMDPPEHLHIIKAQELLKEGTRHWNLTLEHHQVQVLLHSLLNLRTLLCVQHMAKVVIGAEIALTTIFATFVGLPLTATHMCRASQHRVTAAGSPVCIYCGKTNNSSAYCRYRPIDNWEEPRNTPDALRTGTIGMRIWLRQPEIKLDLPIIILIRFLSPMQMV